VRSGVRCGAVCTCTSIDAVLKARHATPSKLRWILLLRRYDKLMSKL
jgi:hypothetical protein